MGIVHNWTRPLPQNCTIYYVRRENEWIILELYCNEYIQEVLVNTINGRIQQRERHGLELMGVVEARKNMFIATCYRGYGNKVWNKIVRGLSARMVCRMDVCVLAVLKPDRMLEISLLDRHGEIVDTIKVGNIYDFHIGGSRTLIAVSTIGFREESTTTTIVDPTTLSVIEHLTGFGGYVLASMNLLLVYGYREGVMVTKVYSSEGEEVLEVDGIPTLPPFLPFAYSLDSLGMFESKIIAIMDKHEIKAFDTYDYSQVFAILKPPFTRGVFDVNIDEYSVIVLTNLIGKPYLAKYGQAGDIKWISHILHGVNYVLASDKIVAVNHREPVRETRVYRIVGNTLVHEDTFGSQVYPLLVRGDTVILTNNKVVSSYSME